MCKNLLSRKMYDFLTWHTKEIAKEQEFIFRERFSEETQESMNFEAFFKEYLTNINNYLGSVTMGTGGTHNCPFVIIGSIIEVHDSNDMEDYQYRIVLPYKKQQDTSIVCASCLSPLGKSLLFKSTNDNVNIQIPAGELHYTIKKITIPEVSTSAVNCQVF